MNNYTNVQGYDMFLFNERREMSARLYIVLIIRIWHNKVNVNIITFFFKNRYRESVYYLNSYSVYIIVHI